MSFNGLCLCDLENVIGTVSLKTFLLILTCVLRSDSFLAFIAVAILPSLGISFKV